VFIKSFVDQVLLVYDEQYQKQTRGPAGVAPNKKPQEKTMLLFLNQRAAQAAKLTAAPVPIKMHTPESGTTSRQQDAIPGRTAIRNRSIPT
jgi:hypothetical protein